MRNIKFYVSLLSTFLLGSTQLFAQDFHLSQYDASGQFLNPALTGMYMGDDVDYTANIHHRSQWRTLGYEPFNSFLMAGDFKFQEKWGFGGYIMNNSAGGNKYNSFNFMLSAAYEITLDPSNTHILTTGLQMGVFNKSFDFNDMLFDSQYDPSTGIADGSIASGENFGRGSVFNLDANLGVFYKWQDASRMVKPYGGFAVFHVNMPDESFYGTKERLPMRFVSHAAADIELNDQWELTPMLLYMNQGRAWEFNMGVMAWYGIQNTDFDVMLGSFVRAKDAAIIQMGVRKDKRITFRMSYDFNTSPLSVFTRGRGGFEMGLIYRGSKGYVPKMKFK